MEVVLKLLPCVLLEQQVLLFGDAPRTSVVAFLLRSMRLAKTSDALKRCRFGPFGLRCQAFGLSLDLSEPKTQPSSL